MRTIGLLLGKAFDLAARLVLSGPGWVGGQRSDIDDLGRECLDRNHQAVFRLLFGGCGLPIEEGSEIIADR
jgi:hypothetical protein